MSSSICESMYSISSGVGVAIARKKTKRKHQKNSVRVRQRFEGEKVGGRIERAQSLELLKLPEFLVSQGKACRRATTTGLRTRVAAFGPPSDGFQSKVILRRRYQPKQINRHPYSTRTQIAFNSETNHGNEELPVEHSSTSCCRRTGNKLHI